MVASSEGSAALFQSALPRGERPVREAGRSVMQMISIRAPARGATHPVKEISRSLLDFNPRSREGSDWYQ